MGEQRQIEIPVGGPAQEWSDEIVAQCQVLAGMIARSMRQKSTLEQDQEQRERAAREQELARLRAALTASENRAIAAERDTTERLHAMQHHYELQVASLERELERRGSTSAATAQHLEEEPFSHAASRAEEPIDEGSATARTRKEPSQEAILQWAVEQQRSPLRRAGDAVAAQWTRLRADPVLLPVSGFLAGLLITMVVYPLLHRPAARPVNRVPSTQVTGQTTTAAQAQTAAAPVVAAKSVPPAVEAPPVAATSPVPAEAAAEDKYAVVLAGGRLLTADRKGDPSAAYEAQLAMHAGYTRTSLYQRDGRYVAVVLYPSREEAQEGIKAINGPYEGRWKRTSSIVALNEWCAVKKPMEPVVINGAEIAVWSCVRNPG